MGECIDRCLCLNCRLYKKVREQAVVCPECGELSTIGTTIHIKIGGGFSVEYTCNKCLYSERLQKI